MQNGIARIVRAGAAKREELIGAGIIFIARCRAELFMRKCVAPLRGAARGGILAEAGATALGGVLLAPFTAVVQSGRSHSLRSQNHDNKDYLN